MINKGDKIKVVNAEFTSGLYENGDIFTVEKILPDGSIYVKEHDRCLWQREFERLDKYFHGQKVMITRQPWKKKFWKECESYFHHLYSKLAGKEGYIYSNMPLKINGVNVYILHVQPDFLLVPEELIEKRKEKCRYSEKQINEAKTIIGEIITEIGFGCNISFTKEDNKIKCFVGYDDLPFGEEGVASLSPDTVYEESVGKMIALCRATNTKLPDWVV